MLLSISQRHVTVTSIDYAPAGRPTGRDNGHDIDLAEINCTHTSSLRTYQRHVVSSMTEDTRRPATLQIQQANRWLVGWQCVSLEQLLDLRRLRVTLPPRIQIYIGPRVTSALISVF